MKKQRAHRPAPRRKPIRRPGAPTPAARRAAIQLPELEPAALELIRQHGIAAALEHLAVPPEEQAVTAQILGTLAVTQGVYRPELRNRHATGPCTICGRSWWLCSCEGDCCPLPDDARVPLVAA